MPVISQGGPHPLGPFAALHAYVTTTSYHTGNDLWVDPVSSRVLTSTTVASHLVHLISLPDPLSHPKAHQVRKYASSLAFFRSFDIELLRRVGQWSSSASFIQRYLQHHLTDVGVVAIGSAPST